MCGIIGSVLYKKQTSEDILNLKKGINSLKHRGPEKQSYEIMNNVGFGHSRLSIIDLKSQSSNQPKQKNEKLLTYNGEIYNYKDLSKELTIKNINHNPNSDTDVLFNCLLLWGVEKTLKKIDGMFAFAYWDSKKLWLVRDKIGEKFIYWTINEYGIFFSSEIKGLYKINNKSKKVNLSKINEYFYSNFISGQSTIFKEIYLLNPGNLLTYDFENKSTQIKEYWSLVETLYGNRKLNNNILDEFHIEFEESIISRSIADVDIGLLVSGGIDSQSILQSMISKKDSLNIYFANNIQISENEKNSLDECINMFKKNDPKLNFNYHEINYNLDEYLFHLNKCSKIFDEPIVYVSSPQSAQITKLAKSINNKVLLSGEGADEIFFGYDRMVKTLKELNNSTDFKTKFNKIYFGSNFKNKEFIDSILINKSDNIEESDVYLFLEKHNELKLFDLILIFFQKYRLQTHLYRLDITSAMNSIEYRCPFLSPRLMTFVNNLDNKYKFNETDNYTKIILRNYLNKKIPNKVINNKIKNGWEVNINDLILSKNKYFKNYLFNLINDKNSFSNNYLNFKLIVSAFNDQYNGHINIPNFFWNIINLELWFKNSFNS